MRIIHCSNAELGISPGARFKRHGEERKDRHGDTETGAEFERAEHSRGGGGSGLNYTARCEELERGWMKGGGSGLNYTARCEELERGWRKGSG